MSDEYGRLHTFIRKKYDSYDFECEVYAELYSDTSGRVLFRPNGFFDAEGEEVILEWSSTNRLDELLKELGI